MLSFLHVARLAEDVSAQQRQQLHIFTGPHTSESSIDGTVYHSTWLTLLVSTRSRMVLILWEEIRWASLWTDWSVWPDGLTCSEDPLEQVRPHLVSHLVRSPKKELDLWRAYTLSLGVAWCDEGSVVISRLESIRVHFTKVSVWVSSFYKRSWREHWTKDVTSTQSHLAKYIDIKRFANSDRRRPLYQSPISQLN